MHGGIVMKNNSHLLFLNKYKILRLSVNKKWCFHFYYFNFARLHLFSYHYIYYDINTIFININKIFYRFINFNSVRQFFISLALNSNLFLSNKSSIYWCMISAQPILTSLALQASLKQPKKNTNRSTFRQRLEKTLTSKLAEANRHRFLDCCFVAFFNAPLIYRRKEESMLLCPAHGFACPWLS